MNRKFLIVDHGRGPQLSTSRITVQDLLPYFQDNCGYEEMQQAMPTLSVEEIDVVQQYVREHFEEVMEEDRRIQADNAARQNPPWVEKLAQDARAERHTKMRARVHTETNGEGHSG